MVVYSSRAMKCHRRRLMRRWRKWGRVPLGMVLREKEEKGIKGARGLTQREERKKAAMAL